MLYETSRKQHFPNSLFRGYSFIVNFGYCQKVVIVAKQSLVIMSKLSIYQYIELSTILFQ